MAEPKPIRSLTLSARIGLSMHSLNNEGTEGNQQLTRMVCVVRPDGRLEMVNAISGDMFKHILAEHLHRIALARGLTLSDGARRFSANRIMVKGGDFEQWLDDGGKAATPSQVIDKLLKSCAVTDALGVLITAGGSSVPRKSVVEFGWIVGVPDQVRTKSYFHVKYDPERGESRGQEQQTGQAIFHRPASSGLYAVVATLELDRVGFNDISRDYPVTSDERKKRARALLESFVATFVEPSGAQRNTQSPHIGMFEGVVALSRGPLPPPCISALDEGFVEQVGGIADGLNRIEPNGIEVTRFRTPAEFASVFAEIAESNSVPEA
jgi:CRISPR-associated protein Cst2